MWTFVSSSNELCPCVEVEQSSYEDDLQILRVIEAYCFSKQRQTITNSGRLFCFPTQRVCIEMLTHSDI